LLRREVFRQVSDDPGAVLHALGIVVLVAMAKGLGAMGVVGSEIREGVDLGSLAERLIAMWVIVMATAVGWVLWSVVSYLLASRFLKGGAQYRQVLRVLGLSYAPGTLQALSPLPLVGPYINAAAVIWVLVVSVVALHEIQEIDWLGTVLAVFLGWVMFFVILPLVVMAPPPA